MNPLKNIFESKYTTGMGIVLIVLACLVIFKVDISPLKQLGELTGLDTNVVLLVIAAAISGVLGSLSKDPKK
jgi:hypothetical protein